jgi:hypothetical protein
MPGTDAAHPAYARAMGTLPEAAVSLFRTPPDRFIVERDALVKELRASGRDDDAAAVKALRKPTATVWALNQVAEREPDALAALFETGRALRAAQSEALAGDTSGALIDAGSARRAAVARLTTATVAVLDEAGHKGAAQTDSIAQALEAASVDADIGAKLSAGTLEKVPTASSDMGLGGLPAMTALTGGGEASGEPSGPTRAELSRIGRARDAARTNAGRRRASADRLARQITEQEEMLERLRVEHAEAESAALEAEMDAERAARAADDAGV